MKPNNTVLSRSRRLTPVLAVVALAGGCGAEPLPPATIAITPEDVVLTAGGPGVTQEFIAVIRDEGGRAVEDVQVKWSSSDTSVATVEGVGPRALMTVVGTGNTVVSAAVGALDAKATVTVRMSNRWVLLKVYGALGGDDWVRNTNWGSDQPLDTWYGVDTDPSGDVVGLGLGSNGLSGPIPSELGNLENLRTLNLGSNDLSGPIPSELGNLTRLSWLHLTGNRLDGAIPSELGNLEKLYEMDLSSNDLSGPIPSELGNLTFMSNLALDRNGITGALPPEFGNLSVRSLNISHTLLSGRLPPELIGTPLYTFAWSETDLCSPADEEFRHWLKSIYYHDPNRECSS